MSTAVLIADAYMLMSFKLHISLRIHWWATCCVLRKVKSITSFIWFVESLNKLCAACFTFSTVLSPFFDQRQHLLCTVPPVRSSHADVYGPQNRVRVNWSLSHFFPPWGQGYSYCLCVLVCVGLSDVLSALIIQEVSVTTPHVMLKGKTGTERRWAEEERETVTATLGMYILV